MARYTASASEGLQGRPILLRHQLAYGGGNLLGSGALAISGAWLLYFYTTFCGLTLIEPHLSSPSPASLTLSATR